MGKISRHRKAFEELAEKAKRELGDSLKKLVLYGSVTRGEETENSDVDIFAVVSSREKVEQLEEIAFDTSVRNEVFIVPIIKTEKEFEKTKDTIFSREVMEQGEVRV